MIVLLEKKTKKENVNSLKLTYVNSFITILKLFKLKKKQYFVCI